MEAEGKQFSLKVREPPHPWEYYLGKQIHNRLVSQDIVSYLKQPRLFTV